MHGYDSGLVMDRVKSTESIGGKLTFGSTAGNPTLFVANGLITG